MSGWTKFPYADAKFQYAPAALKKNWAALHRGDVEALPKDEATLSAWVAFHAGEFKQAVDLGLKAGGAGVNAANKAQAIYANYLEESEAKKLELFQQVAARAEKRQKEDPKDPNGFYWHAYALGRYAQGISIAKALAQGIGGKVRASLEMAIRLDPKHADAHIGLGTYHAEIIDKVGSTIGGLTYGAKKDAGLKHYQTALKLNPDSAIARVEYASGLVMLEGKKALQQAMKLCEEAAACTPKDAMEMLDIELAKQELEDE